MPAYNFGSEDQIDAKTIAQIIIEKMGLKNVKLIYTGDIHEGRGWKGDVKNMRLDISRLKSLRRKIELNSIKATRKAAKHLKTES